ncbi:MAG: hypothetical protein ABSH45_08790 [Bryobacteraceae bacterium]
MDENSGEILEINGPAAEVLRAGREQSMSHSVWESGTLNDAGNRRVFCLWDGSRCPLGSCLRAAIHY